jgi:hypothetical protein
MAATAAVTLTVGAAGPAWASPPVGADCADLGALTDPAGYEGQTYLVATDPTGRYQVGTVPVPAPTGDEYRVVRWRDGAPTVFPGPSRMVDVADVNQSGEFAGTSIGVDDRPAWVYRDGAFAPLPALGAGYSSTVTAINGAGEVAGTQFDPAGRQHAVLWSVERSTRALPLPDGFAQATVTGLDEDGTVVGYAFTEPTAPSPGEPVIWPAGGGVRVLAGPDGAGVGYPVISSARIFATAEGNRLVEWDSRGGGPRVVADRIADVVAVNGHGSVLVAALRPEPDNGAYGALLRNGVLHPVPGGGLSLSDRDVVYRPLPGGSGLQFAWRYDCAIT